MEEGGFCGCSHPWGFGLFFKRDAAAGPVMVPLSFRLFHQTETVRTQRKIRAWSRGQRVSPTAG